MQGLAFIPIDAPPAVYPPPRQTAAVGHPVGPGLHTLVMWSELGGMDPTKRFT